jgi:alkanesulfonate monooxygenase SsuD/methylene tetrahydromethanopterin reductase-like flavin-dependent oxidoreductase (luciferase family)
VHPHNIEALRKRVVQAAEAALAHHGHVSPIDILVGAGCLTSRDVDEWRRGRVDYLERVVDANLRRISLMMKQFRQWARARGLNPSETQYRHKSLRLRFNKYGDPEIERAYRTHYVSPEPRKGKRPRQEAARAADTLAGPPSEAAREP